MGSAQLEQSRQRAEAVVDCFDYLMNTLKTYRMLGEVLAFFERSRVRNRRYTFEEEYNNQRTLSVKGERRWSYILREALRESEKDFKKNFPEEDCTWSFFSYDFYFKKDLLLMAFANRDRWDALRAGARG